MPSVENKLKSLKVAKAKDGNLENGDKDGGKEVDKYFKAASPGSSAPDHLHPGCKSPEQMNTSCTLRCAILKSFLKITPCSK